jgi:diguanylate cyclase (GGDEF)-like protein/PAS domain S-box-containing protein
MLDTGFRASLKACPVAALVLDAANTIVFANGEANRLLQPRQPLTGSAIEVYLPDWPLSPGSSPACIVDGIDNRKPVHVRTANWSASSETMTIVFIEAIFERRPADTAEADARLRTVMEMLPQAVCVFDAEDRFVLWKQKYAELYSDIADYLRPGIPFEEILRISLAGDDMREVVVDKESWLADRMEKFRRPVSQEEQQLRDGRWLRHDDRRPPDGGAIGMRIDITRLKQREEWLRQLFDANPMPMLLCDGESLAILQANQAACDFYGWKTPELLLKNARDLHAQEEARPFATVVSGLTRDCDARTVWRQYDAGGNEHHVLIYVRLLHEGASRRLLLTIADVSDRIAAETEANRLAHHDVLTGLPNRIQFYKALGNALKSTSDTNVFVFCLDLDDFKPVNDTFGHAAGDDVLKMVSDRLRTEAQGHMIARLGGDEFAILMNADREDAEDLAKRCVAACERPFSIRGLAIKIGVSIGIAAAPSEGVEPDALLQEADRAMYRAKVDGRNRWRLAQTDSSAEKQGPQVA